MLVDARTGEPVVPNGSLGHRYGEAGVGKWNLDLGDVDPLLSLLDTAGESVVVRMPRFDTPDGAAADLPRGVPVRRVGGHLVTTVFDLLMAQYGVGSPGPAGRRGPTGYDDAGVAVHPGLAGGHHRCSGRDRGPDRARVRPERRGVARAAR